MPNTPSEAIGWNKSPFWSVATWILIIVFFGFVYFYFYNHYLFLDLIVVITPIVGIIVAFKTEKAGSMIFIWMLGAVIMFIYLTIVLY